MLIKKAILPVAGLGTRTLPASKAIPKEMFPIVNKPVIQYLVEEAVNAGITEIIMVISKDKEIIKEHFSENIELEKILEKKGRTKELEEIKKIKNLANIKYTYQEKPHGDGHAILCAKNYIDSNEAVAVLFGDDIVKNDKSALQQLIETHNETNCSVIAVTEVEKNNISAYGVVDPIKSDNNSKQIKGLVEKPKTEEAPSNLGIIGKYIVTPQVLKNLQNAESSHGGEIRLIDGFIKTLENKQEKIYSCTVTGIRFDTGMINGLIAANNAFASN